MREFQLSRYIQKWLPLILVLCIGLTAAAYLFFSASRRYIASAVIHYNDENAQEGLTPLGTELDVNEIKSSSVMSRVIDALALDSTYSVDDLITRVKVTEVVDEDEAARKEALLDEGEEYTYKPTTYIVSFAAENQEGEAFARQVLDEILDLYFADYSEKYVNSATTNNFLSGLHDDNYDYIEIMELIDDSITSSVETLNQRSRGDPYFRSTQTGMAFMDLANDFYFLQHVRVSKLFATIFQYQITKDKGLLIADYSTRIQNHMISNLAKEEEIADVLRLIDAYVAKMRDSGNTNITFEYILDDVYEKDLVDIYGGLVGQGDQTVTYDKLIFSWRDHSESREYALIDSAYCRYIIDVFSRCTGGCGATEDGGSACALSGRTCTELSSPQYEAAAAQVEREIEGLVEELVELHAVASATDAEYNEYRGAQSISMLSTVAVEADINVALYTAIAAVFLLIVCGGGAVLLGRLNDIIQYVFYTDHMTGLNNRTAFDAYLKERDRRILDSGVACVTVNIVNQVEINRKLGREIGDTLIQFVAGTLKEVFQKTQAYLVYNGNAQFVIIVEKTDCVTVEYILQRFRLLLERRDVLAQERIAYEIGLSESGRDSVSRVRGLLSKAFKTQARYIAEPVPEGAASRDKTG